MDRGKGVIMTLATPRMVLARTLTRLALATTAFAGALWISPAPASAQIRDIEPFYVEITNENVYLRCGDGESWYPVGQLDAGTVLLVDGEGYGWYRVSYPAGLGGLVRADEGEPTGQGTVRLSQMTALRAYNHNAGVVHSWKKLLPRPVPSGATLNLIETVTSEDGSVEGYLVEAPITARGYISTGFTQRIDDATARARIGSAVPQNRQGSEVANAPTSTPNSSAVTPADTTLAQNTTDAPEIDPASAETEDTAQNTIAGSLAARPSDPTVLTMGGGPALGGQTQASLESLNNAFERVIAQPIEEAEFTPLIEEHERLLDVVVKDPTEQAVADYLQSRIDLLKIRVDLQESMIRMAMLEARAREEAGSVDEQVAKWRARPEYVVVGRLSTSAVYDGKRMPLLYRIQSIDGSVGRTLAYVAPNNDLDIRSKLGAIVGVVGQKRTGETTRAATITATKIDVLSQ